MDSCVAAALEGPDSRSVEGLLQQPVRRSGKGFNLFYKQLIC